MPRDRHPTTGYARIAQAEESDSENDELGQSYASLQAAPAPRFASIQPRGMGGMYTDGQTSPATSRKGRRDRRARSNSGVDIKAINARLERWADEIASKFKINKVKGKSAEEETLEIHISVFQAPDSVRPATAETLAIQEESGQMTKEEFEAVVESVRVAIEQGMHPKMITQGSSGSYFARNTEGKVVGVFKPKDEEPYAAGNPKWNKWIHRNLFPCCFGRACLIPNLSYVSEAAAYTLDCRLRTNLVPYTDIVNLTSKSFHYNYWERRNFYRNKKALPPKVGSFQVFLKGFKDANIFLREHPWPDHVPAGYGDNVPSKKKRSKTWQENCRPTSAISDDEDEDEEGVNPDLGDAGRPKRFVWTATLQQSFREELEKLVVLDYIMRNTDRGLDNWMIKVDYENQDVSIVSEPPRMNATEPELGPRLVNLDAASSNSHPYHVQQPMTATSKSATASKMHGPTMSLGAIDNSLSWPWKHPDQWRSFPFGWLFLPVSLIGQPFSQETRDHFLPLLTSKQWWSETQLELRKVFSQDADFQERMFARQIAVMKGQAWNVVETLKVPDHGPLELTRRARVCVWDDLVDIPVSTPMRPSAEMRNRDDLSSHRNTQDEEMDISIANASAPQPNSISIAAPPADLPSPNRFDLTSPRASEDTSRIQSPDSANVAATNGGSKKNERPRMDQARSRMSYEGPSGQHIYAPRNDRRFSFSNRNRRMNLSYEGDDSAGDLGFAAAEGMEGTQRKVIVERLETVKSKNPVFTWC